MVTQKEIAAAAGVSRSAVGFALGVRPAYDAKLRPETRARIVAVARRLGYRPNRYAQVMRGGRSGMIGMIERPGLLQVATLRAAYAAEAVYAGGYGLMTSDVVGYEQGMTTACNALLDARVEGILLMTSMQPADLKRLQTARIPIVQISGATTLPGVSQVRTDVFQGMGDLTRHLIAGGHRRLALLTFRSTPRNTVADWPAAERIEAFRQTLRDAGGAVEGKVYVDFIRPDWTRPCAPGRDAMERLLRRRGPRPDVVLCTNDDWALGALTACRRAGLRVPEDIAITGFDGSPAAEFGAVPLTTVIQPNREISQAAVALLLRLIKGERLLPTECLLKLPGKLVVRESSGGTVTTGHVTTRRER